LSTLEPTAKGRAGGQPEKKSRFLDLGPGWISAITGMVAVILTGVGLLINNAGGGSPTSRPTTPAAGQSRAVAATGVTLPPADGPARVAVCFEQLENGADGNVGPLTCSNGALNELAWDALAANHPLVMSLGPNATPDQVFHAMCSDLNSAGSTNVLEESAYRIAALYYHWQFGTDPGQEFLDGC
jgi:hypothetical protein